MDGKQQIWRERVGGGGSLGGFGSRVIIFAGPERDEVRVLLQPCQKRFCSGGGHLFFLYDSPCTRITAAVPGVYRDAIRRLTDRGAEVIFRFSGGIPLPDGKGFMTQIKAETNGDDAKA